MKNKQAINKIINKIKNKTINKNNDEIQEKNKRINININIYIVFIILIACIILIPLFNNSYRIRHDTEFHVNNITEFTNNLKKNYFSPSRVIDNTASEFGYGTLLFYPMFPYLIASNINLILNNVFRSINITYLISLILSGITMYYCSKRISKNDTVAFFSAITYMLFPYHLSEIYIRDAFAENFLFIFLPMIVQSLYEIFNGNKKRFYILFCIGYAGALTSHLTVMLYFTALVAVFLLIKWKDTLKNLKHFIIATIVTLLIISPLVLPLVESKIVGNYRVFDPEIMASAVEYLKPTDLINYSNDDFWTVNFFIDIVCLVLLIISMANYNKYKSETYNFIILFAIISIAMSTSAFPWRLIPIKYQMFQYSFRFLGFVSLFISLVAPLCTKEIKDKNLFLMLLLIMLVFGFSTTNDENPYVYETTGKRTTMGWQSEYLPVNVTDHDTYYSRRMEKVLNTNNTYNTIEIQNEDFPKFDFEVTEEGTYELPRIFYVGYKLKDSNGNKYKIWENDKGFVETTIPAGNYTLDYKGTLLDNISKPVSLITLLLLLGYGLKKTKTNNNRKNTAIIK